MKQEASTRVGANAISRCASTRRRWVDWTEISSAYGTAGARGSSDSSGHLGVTRMSKDRHSCGRIRANVRVGCGWNDFPRVSDREENGGTPPFRSVKTWAIGRARAV